MNLDYYTWYRGYSIVELNVLYNFYLESKFLTSTFALKIISEVLKEKVQNVVIITVPLNIIEKLSLYE